MDDGDRASFILKWNSFSKVLLESTSKLLLTGKFSDVTLMCEGQRVKCHRSILSAFSPYLAQTVEEVSAPGGVIHLGNGIKFNQLQTLLTFMYTGEVEVAPLEMADLLKVAEELKIKGLSVLNNNLDKSGSGGDAGEEMDTDEDEEDEEEEEATPSLNSTTMVNGGSGDSSTDTGSRGQASPGLIGQGPLNSTLKGLPSNRNECRNEPDVDCGNAELEGTAGAAVPSVTAQHAVCQEIVSPLTLAARPGPVTKMEVYQENENGLPQNKSMKKRKLASKVGRKNRMEKSDPSGFVNVKSEGDKITDRPVVKKRKVRRIPEKPSLYGESMKKAVDMVLNGGGLSQAAAAFKIPISTLSKYSKDPEKMKTSKMYYYNYE